MWGKKITLHPLTKKSRAGVISQVDVNFSDIPAIGTKDHMAVTARPVPKTHKMSVKPSETYGMVCAA
jgi:hypothetical protein